MSSHRDRPPRYPDNYRYSRFAPPERHPPIHPIYRRPIIPIPVPIPVGIYDGPMSIVQQPQPVIQTVEHDTNFRQLSNNLYIVTTEYLHGKVFVMEGERFRLIGESLSGRLEDVHYYTSEELAAIGITYV
jgi:hypothetical protein